MNMNNPSRLQTTIMRFRTCGSFPTWAQKRKGNKHNIIELIKKLHIITTPTICPCELPSFEMWHLGIMIYLEEQGYSC